MLIENIPQAKNELNLDPEPLELVLAEDHGAPLAFIMPPLADIASMQSGERVRYSLKDTAAENSHLLSQRFRAELRKLEGKKDALGKYPIYRNRLANLAALAGDYAAEGRYLEELVESTKSNFYLNRLGENLISRRMDDAAEQLFNSPALRNDVNANLRLAYFLVQRKMTKEAMDAVRRAIYISPLDFGARLFEGSLLILAGKHGDAIASFRIAEEERPNSSVLQVNIAMAHAYQRNNQKALQAAKKAVVFDPLNQNAVFLLADLSNIERCHEDAIPALRYFSELEQTNLGACQRLARALLEVGSIDEAIATLRRQGRLNNDAGVWNNLGVAYQRKGKPMREQAYAAYKHAVERDESQSARVSYLAARNISAMLVEDRRYQDVIGVITHLIDVDRQQPGAILRDPVLSDSYVFLIIALAGLGHIGDATEIAQGVLANTGVPPELELWVASWLIAQYAMEEKHELAASLSKVFLSKLSGYDSVDNTSKYNLLNNIAFCYAEQGALAEAEHIIQRISSCIHRDAYPTATLGLLSFRKGQISRGIELYEEAIRLARLGSDKERIRQKYHLELGISLLKDNASKAQRFLEKAANEKGGAPEFIAKARKLRSAILRLS